ncbi:diguanylate cyclase domain-containing protein [Lysobacter humi (ex Lee et al. 2017)]
MREIEPGGLTRGELGEYFACTVDRVRDYAIFLVTRDGRIATWNEGAHRLKGFTADQAIGQHLRILYPAEARAAGHAEHNLEMAAQCGAHREETWRIRSDGTRFWALVELIALSGDDGTPCGFCKITYDLTGRRRLEVELQRERDRAAVTLRAIADGVIAVDGRGRVEVMNAQAEALTGWTEQDAGGRRLSDVLHMVADAGDAEFASAAAAADGEHGVLEGRDGRRRTVEQRVAPIPATDGAAAGAVVVFRDVTASRERLRAVSHRAAHDGLTGLVNRSEFERRLQCTLDHAAGGSAMSALLFLDLDGFKAVNDTCGHDCGDRLLQAIARTFLQTVRTRDTLARIGGDEFALIVENCGHEEALSVARKLIAAARGIAFEHEGLPLEVGVSIGMTLVDGDAGSIERVLHAADVACYVAKAKGRNRVEAHLLH